MQPADFIGYIGGVCLLLAYFELSRGRWHGHSVTYQLTNLVAGVLLTAYSCFKHAPATIVLNAIFSMIAFYGITKAMQARRQPKRIAAKKP